MHHVDFVVYGTPNGHSAMASTVGYTAAIVTKMVLNGKSPLFALKLLFVRKYFRRDTRQGHGATHEQGHLPTGTQTVEHVGLLGEDPHDEVVEFLFCERRRVLRTTAGGRRLRFIYFVICFFC